MQSGNNWNSSNWSKSITPGTRDHWSSNSSFETHGNPNDFVYAKDQMNRSVPWSPKEQFPELNSAVLSSYLTKRKRRDVGNGISAKLNLEVSTKTASKNEAGSIKVSYDVFFIYELFITISKISSKIKKKTATFQRLGARMNTMQVRHCSTSDCDKICFTYSSGVRNLSLGFGGR